MSTLGDGILRTRASFTKRKYTRVISRTPACQQKRSKKKYAQGRKKATAHGVLGIGFGTGFWISGGMSKDFSTLVVRSQSLWIK
jgi:hypothetical protein